MTQFQLIAVSVFLVALVLANLKTLRTYAAKGVSFVLGHLPSFPTASGSPVLGPRERVRDLVTVSELRDRLAEVGCHTGVEACTLLLRSIVDHPADCNH